MGEGNVAGGGEQSLPECPCVKGAAEHSRGQALPDWLIVLLGLCSAVPCFVLLIFTPVSPCPAHSLPLPCPTLPRSAHPSSLPFPALLCSHPFILHPNILFLFPVALPCPALPWKTCSSSHFALLCRMEGVSPCPSLSGSRICRSECIANPLGSGTIVAAACHQHSQQQRGEEK